MQLKRTPTAYVELTPVTSNGAIYASGDQIGSVMRITNAVQDSRGSSLIKSVVVIDKAKQKAALDILFFDDEPANSVADNAAADIADSEMADKCLGFISIAVADYADMSASSVATKTCEHLLKSAKERSKDLWCLIVSRGTPTYGSTSDLVVKLGFIQN